MNPVSAIELSTTYAHVTIGNRFSSFQNNGIIYIALIKQKDKIFDKTNARVVFLEILTTKSDKH